MKLSKAQIAALKKLEDGQQHYAYGTASRATLEALRKHRLVTRKNGLGAFYSPRTAIGYTITDAGREALKEHSQ